MYSIGINWRKKSLVLLVERPNSVDIGDGILCTPKPSLGEQVSDSLVLGIFNTAKWMDKHQALVFVGLALVAVVTFKVIDLCYK